MVIDEMAPEIMQTAVREPQQHLAQIPGEDGMQAPAEVVAQMPADDIVEFPAYGG